VSVLKENGFGRVDPARRFFVDAERFFAEGAVGFMLTSANAWLSSSILPCLLVGDMFPVVGACD
jgi:hypothetical protein